MTQGEEFPEAHMGGWGSVVNLIDDVKLRGVPLLTSPCPISIHLAMEKVQPCPQQGQDNSQCSEFLLHINVQSSPVQHPPA